MGKAKEKLDLSLARDEKNNRNGFYSYVSQKRKFSEGVCPPIINAGKLVILDRDKVELLNNFLVSVFNGNLSSHTSPVAELQNRVWGRKVLPTVQEAQVHDHLRNLNVHKSTRHFPES